MNRYGNTDAILFSVVYKGELEVDVFLFLEGESQPNLLFQYRSKNFEKEQEPEEGKKGDKKAAVKARGKPSQPQDEEEEAEEPKIDYLCKFPMEAKISKKSDFLSITYFCGDVEIYEIGLLPLIISFIGVDERADLIKFKDEKPGEYDYREIGKLPPLNEFIRKTRIPSSHDITRTIYTTPVLLIKCKTQEVKRQLDDYLTKFKKRKRNEVEIVAQETGKKGGRGAARDKKAVAPNKGRGAKADDKQEGDEEEEEGPQFEVNTKIEVGDLQKLPAEKPAFYPEVYFIEDEVVYKYEDIYNTYAEEKHRKMQDDIAAEEEVIKPDTKLLKKPFLVNKTSVNPPLTNRGSFQYGEIHAGQKGMTCGPAMTKLA